MIGVSYLSVSLGVSHSYGLTEQNVLMCWGRNASGQLGDATLVERATPTLVSF